MSYPFKEHGRVLKEELGPGPSQDRRDYQRQALIARVEARLARSWLLARWPLAAGAAAAVLALVIGVVLLDRSSPQVRCQIRGGVEVASNEWLQARRRPLQLDFSEGSELILEEGAQARLALAREGEVGVTLRSGRLRARVTKREGTRWTYRAGPFSMVVLGTELGICWQPRERRLGVGVDRGRIRVSGGNIRAGGIELEAGQLLEADLKRDRVALSQKGQSAGTRLDGRGVVEDGGPSTMDAMKDLPARIGRPRARSASSRWLTLARAGRYTDAILLARQQGLARLISRLGAAQLRELADAARLGGAPEAASRVLLGLRRRFPGSRQARLAGFYLGRLAMERRRDYRGASRWFSRFLKENTSGRLVPNARGRLMVSLQKAGDLKGAREVARQYLKKHPGGAYTATAEALIGKRGSP